VARLLLAESIVVLFSSAALISSVKLNWKRPHVALIPDTFQRGGVDTSPHEAVTRKSIEPYRDAKGN